MSRTDDSYYLLHMLDHTRWALSKTATLTREQFDRDDTMRLALTRLVQVIGEAARKVSQPTRLATPQIPWQQIVGMRHILTHEYMDVDYDALWAVCSADLPPLCRTLEQALRECGVDPDRTELL
jgi:uncharacterized protein with HEPN domain